MMQEGAGAFPVDTSDALTAARRVGNFQKIADAADFSDPRVESAIRRWYYVTPTLHARQWEFAIAFLALQGAGMLDGVKKGISFGSGYEPLIFCVATDAGHLTVTDLYNASTTWDVARTDDCRAFVLSVAPPGFDASRIDVRSMDMRHIDYPDASFDFAYSISTFEHIGRDADFLEHLRGVRRILKPDGVYVLTTEIRFGEKTFAATGNHAFALSHLFGLFDKAGLCPERVFDHRLTKCGENRPREMKDTKFRDASNPFDDPLILRDAGGIISGPGVFVLRAKPYEEPEVIGMAESVKWAFEQLAYRTHLRFSDWCTFNPFGGALESRSPYFDLWPPSDIEKGRMVFATSFHHFGIGPMEVRLTLTSSSHSTSKNGLFVYVLSMSTDDPSDRIALCEQRVEFDGAGMGTKQMYLRFEAEYGRCYNISGDAPSGDLALSDVTIYARRAAAGGAEYSRNTVAKAPIVRRLKRRLRLVFEIVRRGLRR